MGEYDSVLKYGNEVLAFEKITPSGDTKEWTRSIASAHFHNAKVYYYRSNYPAALKSVRSAQVLFEKIGDKEQLIEIYANIGAVYFSEGDYPEALKNFLIMLNRAQEIDAKAAMALSHTNISLVYYSLGNYNEALKSSFTALKIKNEMGDSDGVAEIYGTIGSVYNSQGNYQEGLNMLFRAVEMYKKKQNIRFLAYSYNNIGIAYQSMGNYSAALRYNEMSLELKEQIGDKLGVAGSYINLGNIHTKLNHPELAKEYLNKALVLSKETGSRERLKESYKSLTTLDSLQGLWKEAFLNHRLFVSYSDSIDNEETKKKIIQAEMRYEFDEEKSKAKAEQEKKDILAEEEKKRTRLVLVLVSCVLVLVFIFAGFVFRSLSITRKQKETIELKNLETLEQKKIIEEKNKDITDSIAYAKHIQTALLREEEHVSAHLPEHFILFLPKDIVSGDFYWAFEKREYWYYAVVDCTGHGVPGAIMSMLGISFLNEIMQSEKLLQPGEILNKLRDRVIHELRQGNESVGNRDGMDISLCRLNLKTLELQWAGANNALNILRNGELEEIRADKQPIGYHPHIHPFTNHEFQLKKGDSIIIYSDGYADQFGGSKGKKFTYKRLEKQLIQQKNLPLSAQKEELKKCFLDWKGDHEQVDDICIMGVRV